MASLPPRRQDERCRWTESFPGPVFTADDVHVSFGYRTGERLLIFGDMPGGGTFFSYGYNLWGGDSLANQRGLGAGANPGSYGSAHPTLEVRASRVKVPEDMVALADSDANGRWDFAVVPFRPDIAPGTVHNGGANVLFCDGHVQWYLQKDLVYHGGANDPRSQQVQRMWNRDHRTEIVKAP